MWRRLGDNIYSWFKFTIPYVCRFHKTMNPIIHTIKHHHHYMGLTWEANNQAISLLFIYRWATHTVFSSFFFFSWFNSKHIITYHHHCVERNFHLMKKYSAVPLKRHIVNGSLRYKSQKHLNHIEIIFIRQNLFENVGGKGLGILFRPQNVKGEPILDITHIDR